MRFIKWPKSDMFSSKSLLPSAVCSILLTPVLGENIEGSSFACSVV